MHCPKIERNHIISVRSRLKVNSFQINTCKPVAVLTDAVITTVANCLMVFRTQMAFAHFVQSSNYIQTIVIKIILQCVLISGLCVNTF